MTYTVPAGTPKHLTAVRFGNEMLRALRARGVTLNELGRASGVGHTAIDHYKNGEILPKLAAARRVADTLDWPKLYEMVLAFRSGTCKNRLCKAPFINDGGSQKVYCSYRCRDVAGKLRHAQVLARRVTEGKGDGRTNRAVAKNYRGVIRELRERIELHQAGVEAFCRACEPDGMCKDYECPLRDVSPLPLNDRRIGAGEARTEAENRLHAYTPEAKAKRSASMRATHAANPDWAKRTGERVRNETPEQRAARSAAVTATLAAKSPAEKSASARKAWQTRRARKEASA